MDARARSGDAIDRRAAVQHLGARAGARRRAAAARRLAFRELGLAIGLATIERAEWRTRNGSLRTAVERLSSYARVRSDIEAFWLHPEHRRVDGWLEHANINDVMLATSLAPEGFVVLPPAPS
jgi:hypothetical protein